MVPKEVAHVFASVERAGRFSVYPKGGGALVQETFVENVYRCCLARTASWLVGGVVNLDRLGGDALLARLHGALPKDAELDGFQLLQLGDPVVRDIIVALAAERYEGAFRGALLVQVDSIVVESMFDQSMRMGVAVGANKQMRKAISLAKSGARRSGATFLLLRRGEVEIISSAENLSRLFVCAYSIIGAV